ncbi:MAG: hypothetical protein JJU12_02195 [Chlamydiales bacterium]|nr:hypothetical protein [Chlamydiales bacterium]
MTPVCGNFLSDSLSWISSPKEETLLLRIKEREAQLDRFQALDRTSDSSGFADSKTLEIGNPELSCDAFPATGFPSKENRVFLSDQTPTNGALIWKKLILIGGPKSLSQIEYLWRIAAEKNAAAIVRLGPLEGYLNYCPSNGSFQYQNLTVNRSEDNPRNLFYSTTCKKFLLKSRSEMSFIPVYAVEGWKDFETNQCEEVHNLILELDDLGEGPLIIHCRGGFGRTGTFSCCWKIYQEFKVAQRNGTEVEIDPASIVDELRDARTATVQTDGQFNMILAYIDYLNALNEK